MDETISILKLFALGLFYYRGASEHRIYQLNVQEPELFLFAFTALVSLIHLAAVVDQRALFHLCAKLWTAKCHPAENITFSIFRGGHFNHANCR